MPSRVKKLHAVIHFLASKGWEVAPNSQENPINGRASLHQPSPPGM